MEIAEFISQQSAERQATLTAIHETILANDPGVTPVVKAMMGKEMILYEERFYMKYGLASTKTYLSLHCMPIYMNPVLHTKYAALLSTAKFQKGCINFTDISIAIVADLIRECSAINIADLLEKRKKKK